MNISKNQWIIIAVGAIAVWYFFLRKKDTKESGSGSESNYWGDYFGIYKNKPIGWYLGQKA